VDSRAGLDEVEKRKFLTLPGLELLPLGRPARIRSLYRLSYPGTFEPKDTCKVTVPAECEVLSRNWPGGTE
jgi:hypothetical protein